MTLKRMDNVLIVVDDLEAVIVIARPIVAAQTQIAREYRRHVLTMRSPHLVDYSRATVRHLYVPGDPGCN